MADLAGFAQWSNQAEGRLTTLEHMSDEQADKVSSHQGALSSMDRDISAMQQEFRIQRGMLQAHHLTQQEQSVALRELKAGQAALQLGQAALQLGQAALQLGQAEMRAGIRTIIGLLDAGTDGGAAAGSD